LAILSQSALKSIARAAPTTLLVLSFCFPILHSIVPCKLTLWLYVCTCSDCANDVGSGS
jgi:hypothetical protein